MKCEFILRAMGSWTLVFIPEWHQFNFTSFSGLKIFLLSSGQRKMTLWVLIYCLWPHPQTAVKVDSLDEQADSNFVARLLRKSIAQRTRSANSSQHKTQHNLPLRESAKSWKLHIAVRRLRILSYNKHRIHYRCNYAGLKLAKFDIQM